MKVENSKVAVYQRGIENFRKTLESLKMTQWSDSVVKEEKTSIKNMALPFAVSK